MASVPNWPLTPRSTLCACDHSQTSHVSVSQTLITHSAWVVLWVSDYLLTRAFARRLQEEASGHTRLATRTSSYIRTRTRHSPRMCVLALSFLSRHSLSSAALSRQRLSLSLSSSPSSISSSSRLFGAPLASSHLRLSCLQQQLTLSHFCNYFPAIIFCRFTPHLIIRLAFQIWLLW